MHAEGRSFCAQGALPDTRRGCVRNPAGLAGSFGWLRIGCMSSAKVAIIRTRPETVLEDYHRAMSLAGYREVIDPKADTGLKVNISWHFFYPAASTTPWQLEGVIRAMERDGYDPNLI